MILPYSSTELSTSDSFSHEILNVSSRVIRNREHHSAQIPFEENIRFLLEEIIIEETLDECMYSSKGGNIIVKCAQFLIFSHSQLQQRMKQDVGLKKKNDQYKRNRTLRND